MIAWSEGVSHWLDAVVDKGNDLRWRGKRVAPDRLITVGGVLACVLLMVAFSGAFPGVALWKLLTLFFSVSLLYIVGFVMFLKRAVIKTVSLSFLQDTLVFILPVSALVIVLLGIPWQAGADLVGLILPLALAVKRIDCFFSGCCFGVSSRFGVEYSERVISFLPDRRRLSPTLCPKGRVFPMPLVEALMNVVLLGALLARLFITRQISGETLPLYFLGYAVFRFVADFFRVSSVRPRRGPFSEAQLISVGVAVVSLGVFLGTGLH